MTVFVALMVCGILLIVAEKMVPKGVFGSVGALFLTAGLATGYVIFPMDTANAIVAVTLVTLGISVALWMRYFPHSKLARKFVATGSAGEVDRGYREYLNKRGTTLSPLRPSGTALIEGKRVDVIAEGAFVDTGVEVEVIQADGNRVVVRPLPAKA